MAIRVGNGDIVKFAIAPLSGYTVGPITVAALLKRSDLTTEGSPVSILVPTRVRFFVDNLRLFVGSTVQAPFTSPWDTDSTSVWWLVAATWAGGAVAVPRFHVRDGTTWAHANGAGPYGADVSIASGNETFVGSVNAGSGTFDLVCVGIKKADRSDAQVETLSPLFFQAWRDFGFDWLIGFDSSLTVSGAYQDQGSSGTGDETTRIGTPTVVADPAGWAWTGGGAAPTFVPQIIIA
jgi:hypothetical protein